MKVQLHLMLKEKKDVMEKPEQTLWPVQCIGTTLYQDHGTV